MKRLIWVAALFVGMAWASSAMTETGNEEEVNDQPHVIYPVLRCHAVSMIQSNTHHFGIAFIQGLNHILLQCRLRVTALGPSSTMYQP